MYYHLKDGQAAEAAQIIRQAIGAVAVAQAIQGGLYAAGGPSRASVGAFRPSANGYWDDDGNWVSYLRLDVDAFETLRGCAP